MRYRTTILLGAFLLFQVQPQIARVILPWFGGGPAVWSACLLFFQVQLLAGYGYAHLLNRMLVPRSQAIVHVGLLAASLLCLPIVPAEHWKPTGAESPTLHILLLLFATVGLPYLLLAATGPILQSWFAREFRGRSPYRLYALSNVGSLAALLSFPFIFEPNLTIGMQADAWAIAYGVFLVPCAFCAWSSSRVQHHVKVDPVPAVPTPQRIDVEPDVVADPDPAMATLDVFARDPAFTSGLSVETATLVRAEVGCLSDAAPPAQAKTRRAKRVTQTLESTVAVTGSGVTATPACGAPQWRCWIALPLLPSVMLLAVTNVICVDIAVTPFFWVMPLAIYLLTFILTFDSECWHRPVVMAPALTALAILLLFFAEASWFAASVAVQAVAYCTVLFLCGMISHGELVRRKPTPEHLTAFYLCISLGGALGGVFVALLAPLLFDTYLEVEIGLALCVVMGLWVWVRNLANAEAMTRLLKRRVLPFAFGVVFAGAIVVRASEGSNCIERSRNFFGRITVQETLKIDRKGATPRIVERRRKLRHGSTLHGEQITGDAVEASMGHTYFGRESGAAYALRNHPAAGLRPLRVGIIGLGTGTLAHYARTNDHYTFYEIDPSIVRVAETHFTYVRDARSRGAIADIRLGDARIRLERDLKKGTSHRHDILIVDAFSSDAIPVHLLTREANQIYWRHLAADGILLAHVSNRSLDLLPVVRGLATDAAKQLRLVTTRPDETTANTGSVWAILTSNEQFLAQSAMRAAAAAATAATAAKKTPGRRQSLLWTDDFSSLWHVIR